MSGTTAPEGRRIVSAPQGAARISPERIPFVWQNGGVDVHDENQDPEVGAREEGVRPRARDSTARVIAILKAMRELADRRREGPVPPEVAQAFIEQRSRELVEQIKAKLELADRRQEAPLPPEIAAYLEERAHSLVQQVAAILKAKRELADREQEGPVPGTSHAHSSSRGRTSLWSNLGPSENWQTENERDRSSRANVVQVQTQRACPKSRRLGGRWYRVR